MNVKYLLTVFSFCCLMLTVKAQLIFKQTFNGVTAPALPAGWTSTANWVTINAQSSAPVPPYSGGNNMIVQNCGPNNEVRRLQSPSISTIGFSNIVLSYGIRRTAAFTSGAIVTEYSINAGVSWNAITIGSAGTTTWSTVSATLPAAVNNQADIRFRWTFTTTNGTACSGASPNFRIDDVTLARSNTLPITLNKFTARQENKMVLLQWETSNETSFSHFEVEASINSRNFEVLDLIPAKGNNYNSFETYEFPHQLPDNAETIYYRLKLVDENSSAKYSQTVKIKFRKSGFSLHSLYPVPAKNQLTFTWNSNTASPARFIVTDATGRLQISQSLLAVKGTNTNNLDVSKLPAGVFYLTIYIDNEVLREKFIKQ
jgi:hypothetical protein